VPTFTLAWWVREQRVMPIETAVRKLSFEPATVWGLRERGLVQPGWHADLNVIDLQALDLELPEIAHDLPGGAPSFSQRARGIAATVVNGSMLVRDGEWTGALPGHVLRNGTVADGSAA
jgi:N-acyl-D-aspartate/D-glutamate deacylase